MHPQFQDYTVQWFKRAYVYTGSIGDFRYRFAHDDETTLHAAVYSKVILSRVPCAIHLVLVGCCYCCC